MDIPDLTDEELEQIEARAEAASPGPWECFIEGRDHTAGDDFIRIGGLNDAQPDMYVQHYLGATSVTVPAADLDFIANARQDIPRLIAEIRRFRARQGGDDSTE
jgi:predicted oxidoreductase